MVPRIKWRKGSFLFICTILQIDCILALFCWDCKEILNPEDCTNPIECGQDEVCAITEFRINDQSRFNLSCVHQTACNINFDAASAAPILVGKRSVQQSELMCSNCCSTDTCNIKCNRATGNIQNRGWTEWTHWTDCTVTCRGGMRLRYRSCVNQPPGQDCPGSKVETEHCNSIACSGHVDGGWGSWNAWTTCSKSCDKGSMLRFRKCDNPIPRNNGSNCQGHAMDTADCLLQHCPVDGGWSTWTLWSSCSKTCGPGIKVRNRFCNDPNPAYNGSTCHGHAKVSTTCNVTSCPEHVDGGWGSWNAWTTCSKSCDKGSMLRFRKCDNPFPRNNGSKCQGHAMDTADCHLRHCPVDGGWSTWTLWSSCSETCAPSVKVRNRLCNNPNPAYNGSTCHGHASENTTCNVTSCPVDGNWSPWSPWFACNVTCGTGVSMRVRTCSNPAPENFGRPCSHPMSSIEFQTCNASPCPVVVADCRDKIQLCSDLSSLGTICADRGIAAEFCPISCKLCEKYADVQQE